MNRPKVLLADDHRILAEGLKSLLAPHFEIVGIVSDGKALIEAAKKLEPDVVVLDISMPVLNGIDAARQLLRGGCRAKFIFLTMHRETNYAAQAIELGASGFVLKHSAASELMSAIAEALSGGTYITPQIATELLDSYRRGSPSGGEAPTKLTPRQREVLQLVSEGRSAKQIANILRISRRTAEFHKARVMDSLGVQTMAELIQYTIRNGMTAV